jgi:hypothetical protein
LLLEVVSEEASVVEVDSVEVSVEVSKVDSRLLLRVNLDTCSCKV